MHSTKTRAAMPNGGNHFHSAPRGYEPQRQSSKKSMAAPLRISRNPQTASGGSTIHESASVAQAPTLSTRLKTPVKTCSAGLKTRTLGLKDSKDYPHHQSLSILAANAHEFQSSKDEIGRPISSKDNTGWVA